MSEMLADLPFTSRSARLYQPVPFDHLMAAGAAKQSNHCVTRTAQIYGTYNTQGFE